MARKMSEASLENLKLGAAARSQGKKNLNVSLRPETIEILKRSGNASRFIELLVQAHQEKRLLNLDELMESGVRSQEDIGAGCPVTWLIVKKAF
jgi:hypothetical protein